MRNATMKVLAFPFYPFALFVALPVEFFANNVGIFDALSVIRLLLFLLAICGAVFALLRLVTGCVDLAAYVTAILPVVAFTFQPSPLSIVGFVAAASLTAYGISALKLTRPMVAIVNMVTLSLFITPVAKIAGAEIFAARTDAESLHFGPIADLGPEAFTGRPELPSVVHIVLDAYGGRTALKTLFGHDNAPFSDALRRLGFVVLEDVAAPYNQTLPAMSAVVNADFPPLQTPPLSEMADVNLRAALARSVVEGAAIRVFRSQGHQIVYTTSGYGAFRYPRAASLISPQTGAFEVSLFDVYFLLLHLDRWGIHVAEPATRTAPLDRQVRDALSPDLVDRLRSPFFLYSHILAPHPPFTMDRAGRPTNRWGFSLLGDGDHAMGGDESLLGPYREGYLEKLRYVNAAVLGQVARMIDRIEGPLIIVVQGDHGSGSLLSQDSLEKTCLMERMRTTVAIYSNVPEVRAAVAARGIDNTVNIYRVLFAALTGTSIPDADGQYFSKWRALNQPVSLAGVDFDRNCER
jgi:hypothetical protein